MTLWTRTAEQVARDLIDGVCGDIINCEALTAGDVVELANLVAFAQQFSKEDGAFMRDIAAWLDAEGQYDDGGSARAIADKIENRPLLQEEK